MSHVKIEFTEQELREKYAEHVNERMRLVTIGEMLDDEDFKRDLIENHLGGGGRDKTIPVSIQVR